MGAPQNILIKPLLSEKTTKLQEELNQYMFEVHPKTDKIEIERTIKKKFPKVTVLRVATVMVRGKPKRVGRAFGKRRNWKKAIVTLKAGDKIEFFEGL